MLETINDKLCNPAQAPNHNQCQTAMRFNLLKKTNGHRPKHMYALNEKPDRDDHFLATSSYYIIPECTQGQ